MLVEDLSSGKLELCDGDGLALLFVGCGSAFSRTMHQNNVLLSKGSEHLLIDCGTGCPQALFDVGMDLSTVKNFLITHTHADHIGGLEEVMMVNRYVHQRKTSILITEEFEDILWNHSLRGGAAYSEVHDGKPLGFRDYWNVLRPRLMEGMPRETWEFEIGSINIKMPRTMHFPDNAESWRDSFWSCAVIFDERVLFTSDTRFDPDLLLAYDELYGFEYIFHDCQFFTGGVHASLEELATLPEHIRKRIILMHYGDTWPEHVERIKEAGFHSLAKQTHRYHFPDTTK